MKIALIVPTYGYPVYPIFQPMSDFPVGFAYIAAALKKASHEVIGLNLNNDLGYPSASIMIHEKIKKMLEDHNPDLIGLGGLCTDYKFIRDALGIIRNHMPSVPVVCGGGIITNDAEFVFNLLKPDYCIIGDAEENLVRLVEFLETGNTSFDSIPNLGYWQNGVAKFSATSFDYPPVETRAFPDYSPFDPEIMLANSIAARWLYRYSRPYPRIMSFVAARGCPFKCTFCVHQGGPKYRARPMTDILEEIAQLYKKYQFNILIILDELFAIDKKRLREFCDGIMEGRRKFGWDFDWFFQTHANANLGHHELTLAKEAGCYSFSYGMESASPRVLASMNKKSRPEQISEAIRLAKDVGIGFGGNYIFGDIAETPETIKETMDFFLNYCMDIAVFIWHISPYPGSKLFEHCLQHGIIKDKNHYYENMNFLYCMTSIPYMAWYNWVISLVQPMSKFPHLITVEPLKVNLDDKPRDDKVAMPLWLIEAKCPHCNVSRLFREPVSLAAVNSGNADFITGCLSCGKIFKIAAKGDGCYTGDSAQRSIAPEALKSIIYDSILKLITPVTKSLDLGCGSNPKNPYKAIEVFGVDIHSGIGQNISNADLAIEGIPFTDCTFDFVTAYQLLEYIPKILYLPQRRNSFVELMNEIYRVLKVDGLFLSVTRAYPHSTAFADPTYVNIIAEDTFQKYFDDTSRLASQYGFTGYFHIIRQEWMDDLLVTQLQKKMPLYTTNAE